VDGLAGQTAPDGSKTRVSTGSAAPSAGDYPCLEPGPRPDGSPSSLSQRSWDRLAWLAALLLDSPISWVALETDDLLAVAGSWGIDQRVFPSDPNVAGPEHLLRAVAGSLLVVDDVARHLNPSQSGAITTMGGAACISAPFQSAAHSFRGTLCVIAPESRPWSIRDAVVLVELGNLISTEIELREQLSRLAEAYSEGASPESARVEASDLPVGVVGHDRLTGLPNRLLLYDRLRQALTLSRRYGEVLGVFLVDVHDFAAINEIHGNATGDRLLQHVAACINLGIRESDTVARLGGDEFMIVLPRVGSSQNAIAVAAKILRVVNMPLVLDGRSISIHATIGIALYPDDADDAAGLVHLAEIAVYKARAAGENFFIFEQAQQP
jgi:diguanylate cyclase (GGDEF)-like protein